MSVMSFFFLLRESEWIFKFLKGDVERRWRSCHQHRIPNPPRAVFLYGDPLETTTRDASIDLEEDAAEGIRLERVYSTQHYQAILELPSSIYPGHQESKHGQEVCGFCLFSFESGDTVKTIPACNHFFHGKSVALILI
jgi:hypothetical protein